MLGLGIFVDPRGDLGHVGLRSARLRLLFGGWWVLGTGLQQARTSDFGSRRLRSLAMQDAGMVYRSWQVFSESQLSKNP